MPRRIPQFSFVSCSANFEWISIEDKKDYFVSTMERELRELRGMKNAFIKVCPHYGELRKRVKSVNGKYCSQHLCIDIVLLGTGPKELRRPGVRLGAEVKVVLQGPLRLGLLQGDQGQINGYSGCGSHLSHVLHFCMKKHAL